MKTREPLMMLLWKWANTRSGLPGELTQLKCKILYQHWMEQVTFSTNSTHSLQSYGPRI